MQRNAIGAKASPNLVDGDAGKALQLVGCGRMAQLAGCRLKCGDDLLFAACLGSGHSGASRERDTLLPGVWKTCFKNGLPGSLNSPPATADEYFIARRKYESKDYVVGSRRVRRLFFRKRDGGCYQWHIPHLKGTPFTIVRLCS